MSETLITWPDVCVFCGDSNGKVGRTANEHWKQFRCGTEYEVIEGKTAWIQDDECKIAELRTALAAATKRADEAEDARIDATESHLRSNMLLEDAEEKLDAAEQENARLREAVGKWVASYRDTLRERMAADRRRDDHGAYAANETVLADLDTLAALLAQPESASRCMPRPSTGHPDTPVEHRCNICGGVVHFDGTPPVKGNWPAKSRALRAQPEGGPATETCR